MKQLAAIVCAVLALAGTAFADVASSVRGLAGDAEQVKAALDELVKAGDAKALPIVEAFADERLRVGPGGAIYLQDPQRGVVDAATGAAIAGHPTLKTVELDNELRRLVAPVLAQLRLGAADPAVRIAAAEELASNDELRPLLEQALARETNPKVKAAIATALSPHESGATPAHQTRDLVVAGVGHVLYGLSLASVFLFAALGLAITFGVMGVINMAHGEMLTIGAYTTYAVQVMFQRSFPSLFPYYLFAAIPMAFIVATATGILLERTVIRHLYGRPLETLLATWGISLVLIQSIRLIFGASNVAVLNPGWLAGGAEVVSGFVVPYNRMGVILFVIVAAAFVWFLLQRTRLGLQVRAVTQNRSMAACMGVSTGRIDMWTFGIGSGIAGLGGVALSQIGNVGPELGQSYILDSFMVVVLGGVGRIAGTVGAALGLGIVQKFLEPISGAVLGKIAVLVVIILFIQRRPQGMFPVKGRVET
jgi:urea transport system permease protein